MKKNCFFYLPMYFMTILSLMMFIACSTVPSSNPNLGAILFMDKSGTLNSPVTVIVKTSHNKVFPATVRKTAEKVWQISELAPGYYKVFSQVGKVEIPLSSWVEVLPQWETGVILRPGQHPSSGIFVENKEKLLLDPRISEGKELDSSPLFLENGVVILHNSEPGPIVMEGDLGGGWKNKDGLPWFRRLGSETWIFAFQLDPESFAEYKITTSAHNMDEDRENTLRKSEGDGKEGNSWVAQPTSGILAKMKPMESLTSGKVESFNLEGPQDGFRRSVTVWTPAGYPEEGKKYRTVYFHDGQMHQNVHITDVFDHYVDEKSVDPFIAVLLDNAGSWRNAEFLPVGQVPRDWDMAEQVEKGITAGKIPDWYRNLPDVYLDFLKDRVIPEMEKRYQVSTAPQDRGLVGASNGSIVNFYLMNKYPGIFGNIACESGYVGSLNLENAGKFPLKLWFSFGSYEIDKASFQGMVSSLKGKLAGQPQVSIANSQYPGGHNPIAWTVEFPKIYRWWWPDRIIATAPE